MKKIAKLVSMSAMVLSVVANAESIQPAFKFTTPDFNAQSLISKKDKTNFEGLETNRSSGGSIFKSVSPSVVKVLTNDGSGSGIVLDRNGLILTNEHVISGYSSVGIVFANDKTKKDVSIGRVIQFDEVSDLALVKLEDKVPGLIPVKIRKTSPEIGDDVHAIGHPLGEDWTYTRGYISQIRNNYSWQTGAAEHHVANVLQTQTPINPGNSGGPLLNESGELIGVNSFGNTQGEGLNFAIDISTVKAFLSSTSNRVRKIAPGANDNLIDSADENKNGNPDLYVWDESHNKIGDLFGIDRNEDLIIEEIMVDKNENGIPEVKISERSDNEINGVIYYFDQNEDGDIEAIGVDYDRDGEIDKIVEI